MQKIIIILFCCFAGFTSIKAQTVITQNTLGTAAAWDLATCLDYAKQHNIMLNSLRLNAQTSEQNVIAAKAAKLPDLTGSVSEGVTRYNTGVYASSGYGVSSSVTLYNGGYINNNIQSQQLQQQVANLNVAATENDVTLSITQAYLNVLLAKENIVYQQDVVTTAEAQVKQSQQRYDAGTIAKKDLLELQSTLANDKYNLTTAQNTASQNLLTLKQILQLPTTTPFDVAASDSIAPVTLVANLNDAQQTALSTRPEVKSSETAVKVQQTELEKAKYSLRPSLTLGGSLYTGYSSNGTGSTTTNDKYFNQINSNFYQNLGVTLSIPLFDRKVTRTNIAKANINIQQAQLDLQNTRTNLSQEVEQAYLNVVNAQKQYSAAQEQLTYAQEAFRIANEQLKIGVYNIVDYLQQKNLYVQAQQAFTQAKYSSALYTKIYNFYTGVPVTQ